MDARSVRPRDRLPWVIVIGISIGILAVAASYLIAAGSSPPAPAGPPPSVTLYVQSYGPNPGDVTLDVTSASRELDLAYFRAEFRDVTGNGNLLLFSTILGPGTLYQNGSAVGTFEDAPTVGQLGVGDTFHFLNLPSSRTYSFVLAYEPDQRTLYNLIFSL